MGSSRLKAIVMHDGRLNVLCCLLGDGPLAVPQLVARTGEDPRAVRYWLNLLDSFALVEKTADLDSGEPLYAASLNDHPDWVREAVEDHRADQKPDSR